MNDAEPVLRLTVFISTLAAVWLWEWRLPWRALPARPLQRWIGNLGVVAVATVLARVSLPLMPVGAAAIAASRGWGLFNWIEAPAWIEAVAAFLLLDLIIYAQHRAFHAVPALWRLHRMHHSDLAVDATTGLRFHPIEIVLSLVVKIGAAFAFGIGPWTMLAFEVVLNATSIFNHANARMPAAWDAALRLLVVTPDMHRVHHSIDPAETDSNFGFNIPWWDRLFGTYRAEPTAGRAAVTLGLAQFRDASASRLDRLLIQPFVAPK
ncbi:MAG: sterol desaturase family protein [Rhodospirillaceae bacterium]|nr:sterol desaturase family protein [Rhodospirillaceae bacterium]